jgi:hyperosmotically inducible periplasmic protein
MRKRMFLTLPLVFLVAVGTALTRPHYADSQVTASIQDRLYHANVFKHGQVTVAFDAGKATLTGTVDSLGVKLDAERAARKVDNVQEVVNNINVRAEDVSSRQIAEQARKEIVTYYAYGIFDNVSLEAQGNKLTVNGQVSEPFKKEDMGRFLAHVKGVAELENNLEVLPVSQFDDQLRLQIARAIYNDPYFVHYGTQANPPIHIIVKNGHVTLDGVVASQVDRAMAENKARFAGTFFSLTNNLRVEG